MFGVVPLEVQSWLLLLDDYYQLFFCVGMNALRRVLWNVSISPIVVSSKGVVCRRRHSRVGNCRV